MSHEIKEWMLSVVNFFIKTYGTQWATLRISVCGRFSCTSYFTYSTTTLLPNLQAPIWHILSTINAAVPWTDPLWSLIGSITQGALCVICTWHAVWTADSSSVGFCTGKSLARRVVDLWAKRTHTHTIWICFPPIVGGSHSRALAAQKQRLNQVRGRKGE